MAKVVETYIEFLVKKAEKILGNDPVVTSIIDEAFRRLGKASEVFYDIQDNVLAIARMLRSWIARDYRDISPQAVAAAIAALLYFTNPLDIIPDFIPIIGQLDDVLILGYLMKILNKELEKFLTWEMRQGEKD